MLMGPNQRFINEINQQIPSHQINNYIDNYNKPGLTFAEEQHMKAYNSLSPSHGENLFKPFKPILPYPNY